MCHVSARDTRPRNVTWLCDLQFVCQCFKPRLLGTVAGNEEPYIGKFFNEERHRAYDAVDTFPLHEARGCHQLMRYHAVFQTALLRVFRRRCS